MKRVIDYLYQRDDRLVVPIYPGKKDLDFGGMNHVAVAKSFGFSSYMAGKIEKIHPAAFKTVADAENYTWKGSFTSEFMDKTLELLKEQRKNFHGVLGGGCYGPLTVTSDILGIENCNRMAIKAPEILRTVLERVTKFIITLAKKEEEEYGAEFFWIPEPVASLFSPDLFTPLCGQYLKRIFDSISIPGFLHVCGKTTDHTLEMLKTGAQVYSIDWMTDLPKCLARVPEDIVIMGNVSPMIFVAEDETTITEAIHTLLEQTKDYKNFILSSGCQIPRIAPPEKVQLLFDIAREFPIWTNAEYRQIRSLSEKAGTMTTDEFSTYCSVRSIPAEIAAAATRMARLSKSFA